MNSFVLRLSMALLVTACAPGLPRIDGAPGAPPEPESRWPAPSSTRLPPPPPAPPEAPAATVALVSDSSAAGSVPRLELPDVVDLALRNHPATRESWALARAAADQYGAARGALFPSVDAQTVLSRGSSGGGVGGSANQGGNTGQPGGTSGGGGVTTTRFTPSVSLSYLVLDLGGRAGTIEAAKQRAVAADFAHNATVDDVILQAESTLFSFLATRALRDAQRTAVQEAEADLAAAEERFRVGVANLQEVLQTRTALAQARLQLETFEGSLFSAQGTLAVAMGFQANARYEIPNVVADDSVADVAATVDTLINRALAERPEPAEALAQARALAAEIRVARSAGYPALTLSSTGSYVRSTQSSATGRNYSLVLGLQIPIFNGFSRQYNVRAAREEYEAGLARLTSAQHQVTLQAFTSYYAVQTATQRVRTGAELLAAAQQSADVALGRYREGVGTIIDVLLARSALATARAEAIQARWEWRTALAQLAHDAGVLDLRGRPNIPLINR